MRASSRRLLLSVVLAGVVAGSSLAADRKINVVFATGASSAQYGGHIAGYDVDQYSFKARAGQKIGIAYASKHPDLVFTFEDLTSGATPAIEATDSWSGTLSSDGSYQIRVYLMRSSARRNEQGDYTFTLTLN